MNIASARTCFLQLVCLLWIITLPALSVSAGEAHLFGTRTRTDRSLKGDIYEIPTGTRSLRMIRWGQPVGTIYTPVLDIPKRDFREGFPGISNRFEWFAIRYSGRFTVLDDGIYRFSLRSDDGSVLRIDNRTIIDNDGAHAAKTRKGKVRLSRGEHTIEVDYFQGPRYSVALRLWVTPPGGERVLFRTDVPLGRADGPFGSVFKRSGGWTGTLYAVGQGFRLEEMDRLRRPLGTLFADKLDIPSMQYRGGFPFISERNNWFAIRYTTTFTTAVGGRYQFTVTADDGAMLYVDNRLVVDNGGAHAPRTRSGWIMLQPGRHHVRVDYFQAEGWLALQVELTPPGGTSMLLTGGDLGIAPPPQAVSVPITGTVTGARIVEKRGLVDFVSQGPAFVPDGFPDTHAQLTVPVDCRIVAVSIQNTDGYPSLWDTVPDSNGWALAVLANGLRLNRPDGSVTIAAHTGQVLDLYFQDNGSVSAGLTRYQVILRLDNGTIITLPVAPL